MIYNEDRHFRNFGILGNNHAGELFAPVPIFDNSLSMFNLVIDEDFKITQTPIRFESIFADELIGYDAGTCKMFLLCEKNL